jgi:hypothetical protein
VRLISTFFNFYIYDMQLGDILFSDFGFIDAGLSIAQAKSAIGCYSGTTHIIINGVEDDEFYLEAANDLLDQWKGLNGNKKLNTFIKEFKLTPTPAFEVNTLVNQIPKQSVVTDNGKVVGYCDFNARAAMKVTRAGNKPKSLPINAGPGDKAAYFMNVNYREQVEVGSFVSVRVNLSATAKGNASVPLLLEKNCNVDIILEAKTGFIIVGQDMQTLVVPETGDSASVNFKVKSDIPGKGKIRVLAFVDGTELAHIDLEIEVQNMESSTGKPTNKQSTEIIVSNAVLPDLNLLISESMYNGQSALLFRITTSEQSGLKDDAGQRFYMKPFAPVTLKFPPGVYFQHFFEEIEKLPAATKKSTIASILERKGVKLFEDIIPEDLRKLIWKLKDQIKTIKIDSDEPWIPWELCKLSGIENGNVEEGNFFCEVFEITRWIPGHGAPKSSIDLSHVAFVVPADSGLPFAAKEIAGIKKMLPAKYRSEKIPASYNRLLDALSKGIYSAWHFSGHGAFMDIDHPNQSQMILENGAVFTPEAISGKVKNMGKTNPLVFLNACQIGKSAWGLTGISGWAAQFLDAGVAGFIGAYWSVSDKAACGFAQCFYERLLAGDSIGAAVKTARLSIKKNGDPTWLAYSVFADPYARISNP